MRFLLITTALIFASDALSDDFWMCASDYDPRSIMVSLPEKGAASVQLGGEGSKLATFEEKKDEDGEISLRFNFNNYDSAVILLTSLKQKKLKKGENNAFRAGLYDFSSVKEGESTDPIQYVCLPRVDK